MIVTKLHYDSNELLQWISDQIVTNPLGRLNQHTKVHREIGAQYTVPECDFTKPLFDMMRIDGEPIDVWVNYNPSGARNMSHHHVGADLAGCWYLNVPENSGQLVFETGERLYPTKYDYYIWDARKLHWVTTNLSNDPRISIAFNLRKKK